MPLTQEQQKAIDLFQEEDTKILLIDACAGSGKEQPLTSMIQTASGPITMGEIAIGDEILHPTDGVSKVTNVHQQGKKRVFVMNFSDGSSTECGENHIWAVDKRGIRTGIKEFTTKELIDSGLYTESGLTKFKIPISNPVYMNESSQYIHPYILGALIADGCLVSKSLLFSYHQDDTFIIDKIDKLFDTNHKFGKHRHTSNLGMQVTITTENKSLKNKIYDEIKELNLNIKSNKRFIPKQYLNASISQRIELLNGLMDCDGSSGSRNRITYSTSSHELALNVIELIQSLGGLASMCEPDKRKCNTNYRIIVKFNELNPFSLPRKAERITPRKQNKANRNIISIERTERFVEQQCITIDNKDGLYLTDGYIVTHNSHTLIEIAILDNIQSGLCIVYNKSVADENKLRFPKTFKSSTIHSLAYQNTVVPFKLKVGFFNARDIKDSVNWEYKIAVTQELRNFCLSSYLKVEDYARENNIIPLVSNLVSKYIKMMKDGKIDVTHDFYMKFFHMLLANGIIKPKEVDVLALDEAQDSFACTIEIFKLLPAKKKVAVGDQEQAIYSFNNCVNGFSILNSEPGVKYANLNTTFRVNVDDSKIIEKFMRKHLNNSSYNFIGNTHEDTSIRSRAFLTKTNTSLIGKMIDLMDVGQGFNLLRPPKSIFELLMILLGLKKGGFINNPEFRHLQDDVNIWHRTKSLQLDYSTPLRYISHLHQSDIAIKTAIRIIINYGPKKIFDAFKYAKDHYGEKNHEWTLSTVFTSKGFTFDYVEVAEDMNTAFFKAVEEREKGKISEAKFNDILYQTYVIATRHKHKLVNAKFLYRDTEEDLIIKGIDNETNHRTKKYI